MEQELFVGDMEEQVMESKKESVKSWIGSLIIIVVILAIFLTFFKSVSVSGSSMEDTLHDGDYLLTSKRSYNIGEPERGDIVIFPHGAQLFIKRIIGLPGDKLDIQDGAVYLNGKQLTESYIKKGAKTYGDIHITIASGEVFVMGDNRENSTDSRIIGTVKISDITSKVLFRYWPLNKFGGVDSE